MKKFIVKKKIDDSCIEDYSKNMFFLNLEEFAIGSHKRLVKSTKIINGNDDDIDLNLLQNVLAKFPALYSWALVEHILIKKLVEDDVELFEDKMKIWFNEYSEKPENIKIKATQKAIDAQIYKDHKDEIDKCKNKIRDLKYKLEVSTAMSKVWGQTITSLQSVNKRVCSEAELTRMNVILKK